MVTWLNTRNTAENLAFHSPRAQFNDLRLNKTSRAGLTQVITGRLEGHAYEYDTFHNTL